MPSTCGGKAFIDSHILISALDGDVPSSLPDRFVLELRGTPLPPCTYWLDGWMCRRIAVDALESNTDTLVVESVVYHPD